MVALEENEEGRALLAVIGFSGIEAAKDAEWNDIRGLAITQAEALGN